MSESNCFIGEAALDEAVMISPSENLHYEMLTRKFLADEYKAAVKILNENRTLLDAITDRLMRDSVLDQREIAELYAAHVGQASDAQA